MGRDTIRQSPPSDRPVVLSGHTSSSLVLVGGEEWWY